MKTDTTTKGGKVAAIIYEMIGIAVGLSNPHLTFGFDPNERLDDLKKELAEAIDAR